MRCKNCYTDITPTWRRIQGEIYCNSCGCCYNRWKKFVTPEEIYAKVLVNMSKGKI